MNQIKIDLERVLSDIDRIIFGGYVEIGAGGEDRFKYIDIGDSPQVDKSNLCSNL